MDSSEDGTTNTTTTTTTTTHPHVPSVAGHPYAADCPSPTVSFFPMRRAKTTATMSAADLSCDAVSEDGGPDAAVIVDGIPDAMKCATTMSDSTSVMSFGTETTSNTSGNNDHAHYRTSASSLLSSCTRSLANSLYLHMAILLVVPIAFLVAYSATRLADRGDQIDFAIGVTPLLQRIVACGHQLQEERGYTSSWMITNTTMGSALPPPSESPSRVRLLAKRVLVDAKCKELVRLVELSGAVVPEIALFEIQQWLVSLERMRTRADTASVDLEELRQFYLTMIDALNRKMDIFARDPDSIELRRHISQLQISRHMQNWFGMCRAVGTNIASSMFPDQRFVRELHRAYGGFTFLEAHLDTIGDAAEVELRKAIGINADANAWRQMIPWLLTGNYTEFGGSVTPDAWFNATTYAIDVLNQADVTYLFLITHAQGARVGMTAEGLQLLGAVVASSVSSLLVLGRRHRIEQAIRQQLHQSRHLNRVVARFVPNNQLRSMGVRSITEVKGGDYTEIAQSLLFSDIRGFTTISESKGNAELFGWLQKYFDVMSKVTIANSGFIDKFIGDAVFAVFTSPTNAIDCAIAMHAAVQCLNAAFLSQRERDMIRIGVGVHHGLVCCGVFGDSSRLTCTMVSSAVDVASRLEGATKALGAGTLVSAAAADRVDLTRYEHRYCGEIYVHGSSSELKLVEIFQSDPLELKDFKTANREKFERALTIRRDDRYTAFALLKELSDVAALVKVQDAAVDMYLDQLTKEADDRIFKAPADTASTMSASGGTAVGYHHTLPSGAAA